MRLNIYGNQPIITPRDPQVPMEAANKNYVDNMVSTHSTDAALHLSVAQNTLLDNLSVGYTELNQLSGITGNVQTLLNEKVSKSGDTMSGFLSLHSEPTDSMHAATKQYVDFKDGLKVSKAGDTMTGALTLSGDPTSLLHATSKQYVDNAIVTHTSDTSVHLTAAQTILLDGLTVTHTEINQLQGVTANVQTQVDSKVAKAGDTMTGPLVLSADPAAAMQATTKQYTDNQDALKVAKSGDTMTGALVLPADPVNALEAAPKQYVDSTVSTHANDQALHLTTAQNDFLDAVTVTATEVNYLSGTTSNVQTQINTKFDKTGGLITGDVTLESGKTVFVSKVPSAGTEVVNKAYVDSMVRGIDWKDPVSDINLVSDQLSTPPVTPVVNDVYIVNGGDGDWAGRDGYAVYYNGTTWINLQDRPVQVGDRFGVALTTSTVAGGILDTFTGKIVTVTALEGGVFSYQADTLTAGSTTLVFDEQSKHFGVSYTYTDAGVWIPTNTSVNLTPGEALSMQGNILNINTGNGVQIVNDELTAKVDATTVGFNGNGEVFVRTDGSTITVNVDGLHLNESLQNTIADAVTKTGTSTITGSVVIDATGTLQTNATPTVASDVVNKGFVDAADTALQGQITTLQGTVATLNTDPVTKSYTDAQDALKVAKAGDTMTGALTLNADPTSLLHAATKQYVDTGLDAHVTDTSVHLTAAQNTLLDGLTVTHTEINQLQGVNANVQTQIDAKVAKAGDTMTGALVLHADPVAALQAATKNYVDGGDAQKVDKAGDIMTGALILSADPTVALEATTKQYVDTNLSSHASDNSLHLTAAQNTFLDAVTVTAIEVNHLSGTTDNVQDQIDSKLNLTGGTLTGALTLNTDPVANLQAATKQYVDSNDALKVAKAGDTMTGHLSLSADPIDLMHAATKQYVDGVDAARKTYVDNQDATKVSKSGDTMTGHLTLNADPSALLHAATKQYVDSVDATRKSYVDAADTALQGQITTLQSTVTTLNADPVTKSYVDSVDAQKVAKAGDTMTGYLVLHADPQQNMHPATKQYVDAVAQGLVTKPSVRFATTENLNAVYNNGAFGVNSTLTGAANGTLSVDGFVPVVGDRILVKDQTNKAHNGDYVVQQLGDASTPFIMKRIETIDESDEVPGSYFYVYDGVTLKGTGWVFTVANPITFTIGTDDIAVNQFSGQGSIIPGNGLTIDGNTIDINTANPTRIVVNADTIDLATTGVAPGSYTKVEVDGYGRVTTGTNPSTLAGYGITDGQQLNANLTSLSGVSTAGVLVRDNTNTIVTKGVSVNGVGLTITNANGGNAGDIAITSNATSAATGDTLVSRDTSGNFSANIVTADLVGNATTATTLATSRDFSITGDVSATAVSFNGSAPVTLSTTLSNTGVTAGAYTKVTVDAKGRVTGGVTPTEIADLGVTNVYDKAQVDALVQDLKNQIAELHLYIMSRI